MEETKRICPECGTENSIFSLTCEKCAFPFSNIQTCSECKKEVSKQCTVCPNCGNPLKQISVKSVPHDNAVNHKKIGIGLLILSIVICIFAAKTRFSSEYLYYDNSIREYKYYISECRDNRRDAQNAANSYYPGFFKENYEYLVSQYDELIQETEQKIDDCKMKQFIIGCKAILLFVVGVGCGAVGVCFINNINVYEKIRKRKG